MSLFPQDRSHSTSAQSDPCLSSDWFLETTDSFDGPVDRTDLERRWRAGELCEETRVWTDGMGDWMALADVPELTYLITDLPQDQAGPRSSGQVEWRPSTGTHLDALVSDELVGMSPATVGQEPAQKSDAFSIERLGFYDYVGPSTKLTQAQDMMPMRRGSSRAGLVAIASTAVLLLLGLAAAGLLMHAQLAEAKEDLVALAAPSAQLAPLTSPGDLDEEPEPLPEVAGSEAADDPDPSPKIKTKTKTKTKPRTRTRTRTRHWKNTRTGTRTKTESSKFVTSSRGKTRKKVKRSTNKTQLDQKTIVKLVRTKLGTLGPCFVKARSSGELMSGRHRFVVDWTIQANGRVRAATLKAPASALGIGSSLPACFAEKMQQWTFPAPGEPMPISNFAVAIRLP